MNKTNEITIIYCKAKHRYLITGSHDGRLNGGWRPSGMEGLKIGRDTRNVRT